MTLAAIFTALAIVCVFLAGGELKGAIWGAPLILAAAAVSFFGWWPV